jgi:hypothetical protein
MLKLSRTVTDGLDTSKEGVHHTKDPDGRLVIARGLSQVTGI